MLDKYIPIGYTKKAHGSKGQVKIVIHDQFLEDFVRSPFVFMPLLGKPAPFFIENIEEIDDLLLKVEDINSPEEAKVIVSKEVLLREKDLSKPPVEIVDDHLEYHFLVGFQLIDAAFGEVGIIKEIREVPQQELAVVAFRGNETLIPLHSDLIETIDKEGKKVILKLPEGLLSL